jgi:hypothetical protein
MFPFNIINTKKLIFWAYTYVANPVYSYMSTPWSPEGFQLALTVTGTIGIQILEYLSPSIGIPKFRRNLTFIEERDLYEAVCPNPLKMIPKFPANTFINERCFFSPKNSESLLMALRYYRADKLDEMNLDWNIPIPLLEDGTPVETFLIEWFD